MVGISSHPVLFLDPFGEIDLVDGGIGGGFEEHPPLSGVGAFCGGIVWEWCGGTTHHTTLTHAHVYGKHVNQTCLHTRLIWEECEGAWGCILGGNNPHSTPNYLLTFGCNCVRVWTRGDDCMGVWGYIPTQEFGERNKGARALLARAPHIKRRYWSGVESGDSTPILVFYPPPSFREVLVGVDPPTINNTLTCSCGVVVCVHAHNNTNSSPFIAAFVCGGGGIGIGWGSGGKGGVEWGLSPTHTLFYSVIASFFI